MAADGGRAKLVRVLLAAFVLLTAAVKTPAQPPPRGAGAGEPPSGWRLVWADEFDRGGRPDPRNWGYETGFVRNRELQ